MTKASNYQDMGLLHAFLLDGAGNARVVEPSEIEEAGRSDGVLWLHVDISTRAGQEWIQHHAGIDQTVAEALLEEEIRPRSMQYDDGLLAVMRGVNTNPEAQAEDMVSLRLWLEKKRIISARKRRLMSIQDIKQELETGRGPADSGAFLCELTDRLVDRIGEVVNDIEEELEITEARIQDSVSNSLRGRFSDIRRRTARIRRYLAPQRVALDKLSRMQSEILSEKDCLALYEQTNMVTHYVEDLDLARERAMVAQEEILNIIAQDQNAKIYLLSIVAAVFLPLSFLTGLMGMNVAGLPGTVDKASFDIIVGIMIGVAALILGYLRYRKWL